LAGYRLHKPRRVTRTGAVVLGCCRTEHHSASAGDQGAPIHDRSSVAPLMGPDPTSSPLDRYHGCGDDGEGSPWDAGPWSYREGPSGGSDLFPVLGQVQLGQRIERNGGQRGQPHEIRLVLLGEVALEAIRGLDEAVVRSVRADEWDG
jgi:hypothetical protein